MKLSVDTRAMSEKSGEIMDVCSELEENMQQVKRIIYSAGESWKGDAERAFEARVVYVEHSFYKMLDSLKNFSQTLDKFADEYEENEKNIAAKINLT